MPDFEEPDVPDFAEEDAALEAEDALAALEADLLDVVALDALALDALKEANELEALADEDATELAGAEDESLADEVLFPLQVTSATTITTATATIATMAMIAPADNPPFEGSGGCPPPPADAPQSGQNFVPSASCFPQLLQYTATSFAEIT